MRRLTTIVLALMMVMAMSASVFAAGTTSKTAEKTALRNAKLSKGQVYGLRVKYDREDREYDVEFRNRKNKAKYSYGIAAGDGKIIEKSIEYQLRRNSSREKIGRAAAYRAAAKASGVKLATVKSGICRYEYDDGEGTYEVRFRSGRYRYEIEMLAPNGKIKEISWEMTGR